MYLVDAQIWHSWLYEDLKNKNYEGYHRIPQRVALKAIWTYLLPKNSSWTMESDQNPTNTHKQGV
jgi:hypothetical protein